MDQMHPFWAGVMDELKKEGVAQVLAPAAEFLSTPEGGAIAAGGVGLGVLGGMALMRGARGGAAWRASRTAHEAERLAAKAFRHAAKLPPQAGQTAEAPKKGFGMKGLMTAGAVGAGATYLGMRKKEEE